MYYNSSTGYIYMGVVFAHGEQASVGTIYVNGEATTGLTWADASSHVGDGSTTLSTYLTSGISGWTGDDTTLWKGYAHAAIRIFVREANLPGSFVITAALGGREVVPIGGGTAAASANPVRAAYDTFVDSEWRGLATARLHTASWESVEDWCDDVMSDSSKRYALAAIIDDRNPREAAARLLKHCHAETFIGADGLVHLWAEMPPDTITGEWSGTGGGGVTVLTEDSTAGAATTELEVGSVVIIDSTVCTVTVITDDDTFTVDTELTASADAVRVGTAVHIQKYDWVQPPQASETPLRTVPDKYLVRFPNADGQGAHQITATYGAGTDKISEDSLQCKAAGDATRIAETKLRVAHLQNFYWAGAVTADVGAALEPGDLVLIDTDLVTDQPARVQSPIEIIDGAYLLTLRLFDATAYSTSTATTDTVPNMGDPWAADDPITVQHVETIVSGNPYDVIQSGAGGTVFGGTNVTNLEGSSMTLKHNTSLYGRTSSGGTVGLLKVNASNQTQLGDGSTAIYLMSTNLILDASGTISFDQSTPKVALGWSSGFSCLYLGTVSTRTDIIGSAVYINPPVTGNAYINGATTHLGATTQIEMTNNNVPVYGRLSGGGLIQMLKVKAASNQLNVGDASYKTVVLGNPMRGYEKTSDTNNPHSGVLGGQEWGVHKNSSTGKWFFAYNDAGAIKKVELT